MSPSTISFWSSESSSSDANLYIRNGERCYFVNAKNLISSSRYLSALLCDRLPAKPCSDPATLTFDDDPQDLYCFLKAIYHGSTFFLPPPAPTTLQLITAILKLSTKYNVQHLRQRAVLHLETAFPPEFDVWMDPKRVFSFVDEEVDGEGPNLSDQAAERALHGAGQAQQDVGVGTTESGVEVEKDEQNGTGGERSDGKDAVHLGPPPRLSLTSTLKVYALAINYEISWILPGVLYILYSHPLDVVMPLLAQYPFIPQLPSSHPVFASAETSQDEDVELPALFNPPSAWTESSTSQTRTLPPLEAVGKFVATRESLVAQQNQLAIGYVGMVSGESCLSASNCHALRVRIMNRMITGSSTVPSSLSSATSTPLKFEPCLNLYDFRGRNYESNIRDLCPSCHRSWDDAYEMNGADFWDDLSGRFGLPRYLNVRASEFSALDSEREGEDAESDSAGSDTQG